MPQGSMAAEAAAEIAGMYLGMYLVGEYRVYVGDVEKKLSKSGDSEDVQASRRPLISI